MSCSSPAARTSEVTDHLIVVLKITLVVFIASSLLDMGLRLDPPDAARGLRNVRFVGLTLFWGFVASSALAFATTRFLPLAPPTRWDVPPIARADGEGQSGPASHCSPGRYGCLPVEPVSVLAEEMTNPGNASSSHSSTIPPAGTSLPRGRKASYRRGTHNASTQ